MKYEVSIDDFTRFEERKSRNGGSYAYYETATIIGGTIEDGEYSTSAEFEYCPACGNFGGNCCRGVYEPSRDMEQVAKLLAQGKTEDEINNTLWPRNKKLGCTVTPADE
jgi:hypothetical protein